MKANKVRVNMKRLKLFGCIALGLIIAMLINGDLFANEKQITVHITKLRPKIKQDYAQEISKAIMKYTVTKKTRLCYVPPKIFVSIIRAESNFKMDAINKYDRYGNKRKSYDIGLTQIWSGNVKSMKLDEKRLTTDVDYSINIGAIILCERKRGYYYRYPITWWTYYNSRKIKNRKLYFDDVMKFLWRLK